MENKKKKTGDASSYSWNQSQWLQATLSELEKKIKMMLSIIEKEEEEEEDGETFAERAEKYYKNRPKLVEMIQDLHLSYRTLADKYDQQLHSQSNRNRTYSPPTSSLLHLNNIPNFNKSSSSSIHKQVDSLVEEDVPAVDKCKDGKEINNNNSNDGIEEGDDDDVVKDEGGIVMGKEMMRMMEDNMRQQGELIRRNNEKREAIKELWVQIGKLIKENRALHTSLAHSNFDLMKMMMIINNQNKSPPTFSSRLKSLLLPSKFFR